MQYAFQNVNPAYIVDWMFLQISLLDISAYAWLVPLLTAVVGAVALFFIVRVVISQIERRLLRMVGSKKQVHNVKVFSMVISYFLFLVILLVLFFSYIGSWEGFGLGIGFLTAALGWALQKPITGIAGWLMVLIYKPFRIGDRVIIGGTSGDVVDIKLTHIYLAEIGGIVPSQERSQRIILIPNSILFDQNIVNYTGQGDFVLDQVVFPVTFESDLDSAQRIACDSAREITQDVIKKTGQDPYTRSFVISTGINIHVRFLSPAVRLDETSSRVTQEIFRRIRNTAGVEVAYPHTKVLFRDAGMPGRGNGVVGQAEQAQAQDVQG